MKRHRACDGEIEAAVCEVPGAWVSGSSAVVATTACELLSELPHGRERSRPPWEAYFVLPALESVSTELSPPTGLSSDALGSASASAEGAFA